MFFRFSFRHASIDHILSCCRPSTQGNYADAEPLLARATAIWEKALGPEHPSVATALNNRAFLCQSQVRGDRTFKRWCSVEGIIVIIYKVWEESHW